MMIYGAIFILLFGLLPCNNHAFEIAITEPLVVTKTDDFKSRQTTLECSSTQPHEYCCWNTPEISDCQCREKKCVQGVQVSSDENVCKITIDHSEAINMAGVWSCTLLANVLQNEGSNATSELFLVDLNESPIITKLSKNELSVSSKAKYGCESSSKSPHQEITWYLDDIQIMENSPSVELELTRKDFNKSLTCSIQHLDTKTKPIGEPLKNHINLVLKLDPLVVEVIQTDINQYELTTETWPIIDYLRIMAETKIEIFAYNLTCQCYTRSEHSEDWFIQDLQWQSITSVKSKFSITFKPNISTLYKSVNIEVGNSHASVKQFLELNETEVNPSVMSLQTDSLTYIIASVVTIVILCIVVILICVYKRKISEFFQCGEYQVPPDEDDDPLDTEEKAEKKKLPTESDF